MAGIFKDNKSKATRDTWTGITYPARNKCYQALASNEGMLINKSLGWYDLCRKYPDRFEDVSTGRKIGSNGRLAK
jgi:hypothetical protein